MNTSQESTNQPQAVQPAVPASSHPMSPVAPNSPINSVVDALQSVDTNSPQANLNITTISDGNGGRIELNQDANLIK